MALTKCKECGHEVSEITKFCTSNWTPSKIDMVLLTYGR
jgi:hypothetical protein